MSTRGSDQGDDFSAGTPVDAALSNIQSIEAHDNAALKTGEISTLASSTTQYLSVEFHPKSEQPPEEAELDFFEDSALSNFLLQTRPAQSEDGLTARVTVGVRATQPLHSSTAAFSSFLPLYTPLAPLSQPLPNARVPSPPRIRRKLPPRPVPLPPSPAAAAAAATALPTTAEKNKPSIAPSVQSAAPAPPLAEFVAGARPISEAARRLLSMRAGRCMAKYFCD